MQEQSENVTIQYIGKEERAYVEIEPEKKNVVQRMLTPQEQYTKTYTFNLPKGTVVSEFEAQG